MLYSIFVNYVAFQRSLTYFTLKVLPDVGVYSRSFLTVALTVKPRLEAAQTDVTHRTTTLAWRDQDMVRCLCF